MIDPLLAAELATLEAEAVALGEDATAVALRGAAMLARTRQHRALLRVGAILAASACVIPRSSVLAQASRAILSRVSLAAELLREVSVDEFRDALAEMVVVNRRLVVQLEGEVFAHAATRLQLEREVAELRRELAGRRGWIEGKAPGELGRSGGP